MSVTFFDPENKPVYDQDYNQVGGGKEVNFSNANAYNVLMLMGISDRANGGYFGEMDGNKFRKRVLIGLANLSLPVNNMFEDYYKQRLELLLECFSNAKVVRWE